MKTDREIDSKENWLKREQYWRRKLSRLRFGAEPIAEQVERYRRVTWLLTAIPAALALAFLSLFAAFGRPLIGLVVSCVILLPIVVGAWFDHWLLRTRARRYLAERRGHLREHGVRSVLEEET
jgi:small-conductance mechanosensitive channel